MRRMLVLAAAGVVLSACGSSTPAASPSPSSSDAPVTSQPTASAQTTAAVTEAYTRFFSSRSTAAQSQTVLQHGPKFAKTLEAEASKTSAATASATVQAVRQTGPNVATVAFTVTAGGLELPSSGWAVREDGRWKVAAKTFCNLLTLERDAPSVCDDGSVTALPS